MKRFVRAALGVALVCACALLFGGDLLGSDDDTSSRVVRVVDGDTVRLAGLGPVRLIGIDTPEVFGGRECFGRQASAFAKRSLAPGAPVRYRVGAERRDRYGRLLAYVYLPDGRLFNELLAERGYATPLTIPRVPVDDADDARRFAIMQSTLGRRVLLSPAFHLLRLANAAEKIQQHGGRSRRHASLR